MFSDIFEPGGPPERAADLLLKRLDGKPVPTDAVELFEMAGSPKSRVRDVAELMMRQAPASAGALTFAAEVAAEIDEDADRAADLLDEARRLVAGPRDRALLAEHFGATGRVAEGLDLIEQLHAERTGDLLVMSTYARLLREAHHRWGHAAEITALEAGAGLVGTEAEAGAGAGTEVGAGTGTEAGTGDRGDVAFVGEAADRFREAVEMGCLPQRCPCRSGTQWWRCCRHREAAALQRFEDRSRLDGLQEAVAGHIHSRPDLVEAVDEHVGTWLDLVEDWTDEERELATALAVEHAWLVAGIDTESGDDDTSESGGERRPIISYARQPDTPPEVASAVRDWDVHYDYGLWLVVDDSRGPGVWVMDILTGHMRYLAMPEADRDTALRWSVLLCATVPVDGVWRTGAAVMHLSPAEGDMVTEVAARGLEMISRTMATGHDDVEPRPMSLAGRQPPAGVMATSGHPIAAPEAADIAGKFFGMLLPTVLAVVHSSRGGEPLVMNTDGDRLGAADVSIRVADAEAARRALLAHPEISGEEARGELRWWGRPMTDDELEAVHAELEETGWDTGGHDGEEHEEHEDGQPRRWLRGQIRFEGATTVHLNTNSRERVDAFLRLLRNLGLDPAVVTQRFFPTALDSSLRRGMPLPYQLMSEEKVEEWAFEWPETPMPGLLGLSPRRALRRPDRRSIVEMALRELECDAEARRLTGLPAPDVDGIRQVLGMSVMEHLGEGGPLLNRF